MYCLQYTDSASFALGVLCDGLFFFVKIIQIIVYIFFHVSYDIDNAWNDGK